MQGIVRVQSPEEREYARYQAQVEAAKRRVATLQAELAELNQALVAFTASYHARIGLLFAALDQARLAIAQYERRIASLQHHPAPDLEEIERQVQTQTEQQRQRVDEQEAEAYRYARLHVREQAKPVLDAAAQHTLQACYRDLCRRYHPDLATSAEQRVRCEEMMRRINAAYTARDLAALQALAQEGEITDPSFAAKSLGEKLVWAIREVARLEELAQRLAAEMAALRATETHELLRREEAGEQVLAKLETRLKEQVATAQGQLATLIVTYRSLVEQQLA